MDQLLRKAQFRCYVCNQSFARKDILQRHWVEQHAGDSWTIRCRSCGAQVRERYLKQHLHTQKCRYTKRFSSNVTVPSHAPVVWLNELGQSGLSMIVDPLSAPWTLVMTFGRYFDRTNTMSTSQWLEYYDLRGIALRAIMATLQNVALCNMVHLSLALFLLATVDTSLGNLDECGIFINTLIALH